MDTFRNATRESVSNVAYNPAYLADVAKLPHDPKRPVKMSFTEAHKPCIMTYDDYNHVAWEYVLMPVRLTA
jgi:DNA polymerase III sliding clamp (beta) subunit (PCNA family)